MSDKWDDSLHLDEEQEGSLADRLKVVKKDDKKDKKPKKIRTFKQKMIITFSAVAAALALLVGGVLIAVSLAPEEEVMDLLITELSSYREIESVDLETELEDYTLAHVEGDLWYRTDKTNVALNTNEMEILLGYLTKMEARNIASYDLEADGETYGVTPETATAKCTVHLTDGSTNVYYRGVKTADGKGYYVAKEGSDTIYIVALGLGQRLGSNFDDLRSLELPNAVDGENVTSVSFKNRGQERVLIEYCSDLDLVRVAGYTIMEPYDEPVSADISVAEDIITSAGNLVTLNGFITADTSDLAKYGLDDPVSQYTVTDYTGASNTVYIGNVIEDGAATTYRYCMVEGMEGIFKVYAANVAFTNYSPFALVDKYPLMMNIENLDKLTITVNGRSDTLSITRTPNPDNPEEPIVTFFLNGGEVNERHSRVVYTRLLEMVVDGEIKEGETVGTQPVMTVEYQRTNDRAPIVTELFEYDVDNYAVAQDGVVQFYTQKSRLPAFLEYWDYFLANPTEEIYN